MGPYRLLAGEEVVLQAGDAEPRQGHPRVVAVLGTSMNAGKSTVVACLVSGLSRAGCRVGAGKITGTGARNDRMHHQDAGAHAVLDFTDFGYATTFRTRFDIADGIYQRETAMLLRDPVFHATVDAVFSTYSDVLGARAGVAELVGSGLPVH